MAERDKELLGFCGLYCGDCFSYQGKIADQARDLRKTLRQAKFAKSAPGFSKYFKAFSNYDVCYEVLGAMVRLRCKRACRGGGGNPSCKIRACCQKRDLQGCWECVEFESCSKSDFLRPIHGEAHIKNLRKIKRLGIEGLLNSTTHW